jgi:hypothetical protein
MVDVGTGPAVALPSEAAGPESRSRRRVPRAGWLVVGAVVVVTLVVVALTVRPAPGPRPVGPAVPGLTFGVTHTQDSVEPWNPKPARERASTVLSDVAPMQAQSLMGWGALNPEPRRGKYSWSSLDQRIHTITGTGAEPVLTLCCAPDWMKGGAAGSTDWSRIEDAPEREHFADFAALAAKAAERYPQVHRFLVWNELKGFFDSSPNNWDIASYTDLYNAVYRAVKDVRPDAEIGGPYIPLDSWSSAAVAGHASTVSGSWGVLDQRPLDAITYWLEHAAGADFIAVDGGTETRDRGLVVDDFDATEKLAAATEWLRKATKLPIWWAEIYANTNDPDASPGDPRRAAVMAEALVRVARAGASVALLWQPRASSSLNSAALFTSTATAHGGRKLPLDSLLEVVSKQLREDPRLVSTSWDAAASRFIIRTPDKQMVWSAAKGLQGPMEPSGDGG